MPEHIRALIVVLVLSTLVWMFIRPAIVQLIPLETFFRWRKLWYFTTLAWFLSHSFWIYVGLMVFVLLAVGRREAHVFGMYLLLLLAAPPAQTAIPGFGVVDHLFILDHYRLLALALLLPCALRLAQRNSTPRYFRAPMDIMVLGYLLLNTALAFRGDNFTNDVRTALMLWIDFFLPYYVASRSIQDKEGLRHALVGLAIGAVLLSTLAIVEVLRSWKLYDAANSALGLNTFGAYKTRGSFIRPSVTAIDSIVLGYVIVVAAGGYLYLQGLITGRFIRWCGWLALAAGVLGSLSRGPWVGMALLVLVFLLMSPKAFKRILQGAVMSALVLMVLSVAPAGQEIINLLPFVGQEEQGNIDYRADLLTVSMSVIERNLLFGSSDFLSAPELQVMKQGEGIIDIVNSYIAVALHAGLVGLFFFLGMFATSLLSVRRGMRWARVGGDADGVTLGRALFASLASVMFIIFTVSGIYVVPIIYSMLIGLCCAYFLVQQTQVKNKRRGALK